MDMNSGEVIFVAVPVVVEAPSTCLCKEDQFEIIQVNEAVPLTTRPGEG